MYSKSVPLKLNNWHMWNSSVDLRRLLKIFGPCTNHWKTGNFLYFCKIIRYRCCKNGPALDNMTKIWRRIGKKAELQQKLFKKAFFVVLCCNNHYQSFITAFFSRNRLGQWYVSKGLQGKNKLIKVQWPKSKKSFF